MRARAKPKRGAPTTRVPFRATREKAVRSDGAQAARKLAEAIRRLFDDEGLRVDVHTEAVPGTRFRRLYVVAPAFDRMGHIERQELMWNVAANALSPRERLRITMIVTLSPREAR